MDKSKVGGAAHVIADIATQEQADLIVSGLRPGTMPSWASCCSEA